MGRQALMTWKAFRTARSCWLDSADKERANVLPNGQLSTGNDDMKNAPTFEMKNHTRRKKRPQTEGESRYHKGWLPIPDTTWCERLRFLRVKKVSGCVLEAIVFSNGKTVACWQTKVPEVAVYESLEQFLSVRTKERGYEIVEDRQI